MLALMMSMRANIVGPLDVATIGSLDPAADFGPLFAVPSAEPIHILKLCHFKRRKRKGETTWL
jgi:hypothetical protein